MLFSHIKKHLNIKKKQVHVTINIKDL